ncbi:MAG: CARDB domain-containing protein [Candidatus Micrarchaeaceae archaeon]
MKTKYFLLVFAALVILSSSVAAQYDGAVSLTNLSVSPNPVVAGGNATIKFQLYNAYENWFYGATIQPSGSYPLFNVSPLSSNIIGLLDSGLNARYYNYTIRIPNTTPSGVYTVTFTSEYFVYAATGTETASSSMPVSFYVNNKPAIKVVVASQQPSALYSGHNQTINLEVENTGYGTARNVSIVVTSGSGVNILSSVSTFFISNLTQGSSITEPILVSAQNTGQTNIVASTTYYSSNLQQRFSNTQNIALSVAPSAQFNIGSTGQPAPVGATDVPVQFKVFNNGTSAAEQLQLSLQTTYPITPIATTAYVSNLQPGSSTNVTFLVSVDTAGVPGNYPVTLYEQWKQPNGAINQQFSGSSNYFVTVASAGAGNSTLEIAAAIVVIAIIVVLIIRRRMSAGASKKNKKEEKK